MNVVLDTDTSPFAGSSRDPQSIIPGKHFDDTEIKYHANTQKNVEFTFFTIVSSSSSWTHTLIASVGYERTGTFIHTH